MATFYFSYREPDQPIVQALIPLLQAKGHVVTHDTRTLYVGAEWRSQLMAALMEADAVVMIWSQNTIGSQFVPAESGMVRATPRICLMPVLVGSQNTMPAPSFIQDLNVEWLEDTQPQRLSDLVDKLDTAVKKHLEYVGRHKKGWPNVFISHRHRDEPVARALLDCLEECFHIGASDVRCTSVQPYRLPVGTDTADRLRDEIAQAEVVLGILTPDTQESSYVLFELGSAWGQQVWTCPLLARGADYDHIPEPIRGRSSLSLENAVECHQLLSDLSLHVSLPRKDAAGGIVAERVQRLVTAAAAP